MRQEIRTPLTRIVELVAERFLFFEARNIFNGTWQWNEASRVPYRCAEHVQCAGTMSAANKIELLTVCNKHHDMHSSLYSIHNSLQ